ncbi:MAG: class I SAM-dependent methyltransferase [Sphingobium phenoxybenzoativorans]
MTLMQDWQGKTGDVWADEWLRTDRTFEGLHRLLIDRAADIAYRNDVRAILDIGCGAGSTTLALADGVSGARLLGIDISEALVGISRARARGAPRIAFAVADASRWRDPAFVPDMLFSRHGVMFFDDPVAAFENLRQSARPGASLIFSCFRSVEENRWASGIGALLPDMTVPVPPPGAPGPFAFADPAHVEYLLAASGWTQAAAEPVDFPYVAGAGHDPVADAMSYFQRIGPAARALASISGEARATFLRRLQDFCAAHLAGGAVRFPAAAWIWTARKASA